MSNSWIVLLPPLIVLICAAVSRNVILSLILGIVTASFIATDFSFIQTAPYAITTMNNVIRDIDNIYLFAFLILLGVIIELMTHAGGITAYTKALGRYVKDKRAAETTSLLLSCTLFLDDYLNGLTVGSIMRPLTDKMKIPRAKLAFLINSASAPLCLLIPATTWVALVLGQLQAAGVSDELIDNPVINADPLTVYLQTISFIFYPILIIFSAWFIVRRKISFGLMHKHEKIAEKTGNLFGGKEPLHKKDSAELKHGSISGFFVPIVTFVGTMLLFLFYSGNAAFLGGTNDLITALKTGNSFWALFMASAVTIIISATLFIAQRNLTIKDVLVNSWQGFDLMKSSLLVLFFAYTLSAILIGDLQAGTYLASLISGTIPLFALPLMIFLIATLTTAATSSSWGTIAVLFPLTIRMLVGLAHGDMGLTISEVPYFFPTLGALLAGSVAGAHFSPITDSVIMASTATGCYHMDHVQTQMSYATPALIGSMAGFLTLGFFPHLSSLIALSIGAGITVALLQIRQWLRK